MSCTQKKNEENQRLPSSATKKLTAGKMVKFFACPSHLLLLATVCLVIECPDFFLHLPEDNAQWLIPSQSISTEPTLLLPMMSPLPQYSDQRTSRPICHCRICAVFMCVVVIFVILGAAVFLVLYVLRPRAVTYFVENAYLSEFNLTSKGALQCNLKLDVSITNPNTMFGVYYQKLDASAYYDEELIGWVFLPTFYLGLNRTVLIHPVFGGQFVIGLNGLRVSDSMKQRSDGFYSIDIEIHAKMRLKFGALMTDRFCQKIWCELMVPLMPSNNSASRNGEFTRTECKVEYLDWFFPFRSLQGL